MGAACLPICRALGLQNGPDFKLPKRIRNMPSITGEAWLKCEQCGGVYCAQRFRRDLVVCPHCGQYSSLPATERVGTLLDPGSAQSIGTHIPPDDPLGFVDSRGYPDRLAAARAATHAGALFLFDIFRYCERRIRILLIELQASHAPGFRQAS